MYKGKLLNPADARKRGKKPGILIISLIFVLVMAIGGTVAYLMTATDPVENTFVPSDVKITIGETVDNNIKKNITFTNPSDNPSALPVYVRATLVVYWTDLVNGEEQVIAPPAGHTVSGGEPANGWFKVGNIYYYPGVVDPGETTLAMADDIKVTIPDGSSVKCYIDVRAEAIQAEPGTAVTEAWGGDVEVSATGTLTVNQGGN